MHALTSLATVQTFSSEKATVFLNILAIIVSMKLSKRDRNKCVAVLKVANVDTYRLKNELFFERL